MRNRLASRKQAVVVLALAALGQPSCGRFDSLEPSLPTTVSIKGPLTARGGQEEATRVASVWASDAFLDCIRIAFAAGNDKVAVDPEGRSVPPNGWVYRFISPSKGKSLWVTIRADGSCGTETMRLTSGSIPPRLPASIIDSPTALSTAEAEFGRSFRGESGEVVQIYAQVTTSPALHLDEPRDPVPNRPTWQIHLTKYTRSPSSGPLRSDLQLNLDAMTGDVLTALVRTGEENQVLVDRHANGHKVDGDH